MTDQFTMAEYEAALETDTRRVPLVGDLVQLAIRPANFVRFSDVLIIMGKDEHLVLAGERRNNPIGTLADVLVEGDVPAGIDRLAFCKAVLALHRVLVLEEDKCQREWAERAACSSIDEGEPF